MADSVWDLFVRLTADTADYKKSMQEAAETLTQFQEKAEQLASFGEKLALTEGLRELGVEALTAYGHIQRAQIALTALTGSAEEATKSIEALKDVALSDALSFPGLVQAQQRMIAFGFSAQQIPGALQAIADAAGATNKDFDSVAASVERMGLSGTASAKQLAGLGLSVTDLAEVLGVADEEVKTVFKSLDQTDRLEAVTLALRKFEGVGQEVAQGILGQWQNVKTQFDFVLEDIGKGIAPVASELLGLVNSDILPFVRSLAEGFAELPAPIKDVAVGLALAATAATGLAAAVAGLELIGFGAALASVGTAALVAAPWIVGIGAAVAALHFSGAADEAVAFSSAVRGSLSGLADLVQPLIDVLNTALTLFKLLPSSMPGGQPKKPLPSTPAPLFPDQPAAISALNWLGGTDPAMVAATTSAIAKLKQELVDLGESEEVAAEVAGRSGAGLLKLAAAAVTTQGDYKQMADAARQFNDSVVTLYNTFPATYEEYISKLDTGGKSAKSTLDTITAGIGKAESLTESLSGKPLADVQAWIDALSKMQATAKAWADSDAFNVAAVKIAGLVDKFPKQFDEISNADAVLGAFFSDMAAAAGSVPDALNKIDVATLAAQVLESQRGLDASAQTLEHSFTKAWEAYETGARKAALAGQDLTSSLADIRSEAAKLDDVALSDRLPAGINAAYEATLNWVHALRDIDLDGVSKKIGELNIVLGDQRTTLEQGEAKWAATSGAISRIAKTDLPLAIAEEQKYVDFLKSHGAIVGQIYDEESKLLQQEIAYKSLTGADATAEIIQLTQEKAAIQGLIEASQSLGQVYVGLRKNFNDAFDGITKGLADNLIDWNDWGKTLENIGKNVAKNIMETFLTGLFSPLRSQLNLNTGLFDTWAKDITRAVGFLTGKGGVGGSGETLIQGGSLPGGVSQVGSAVGSGEVAASSVNAAAITANTTAVSANTAATTGDTASEAANTSATAADTAATVASTAAVAPLVGALIANWTATEALVAQGLVVQAHMEAVTSALVLDIGAETADTAALVANTAAIIPETAAALSEVVTSTLLTGAEVADTAATAADAAATVADTGATVAATAATAADTVAELANTAALVAETAATAASATASAAGGIGGLLGAVAGGIGDLASGGLLGAGIAAAAGITQGIQMAHLLSDTGKIEVSTRGALNQLIAIQGTLDDYLPELRHMPDIWGAINAVNDQLRYGLVNVNVAEWGGIAGVPPPASGDTGSSLPPVSPLDGMDTAQATADLQKSNDALNLLNQTYKEGQPIFQSLSMTADTASAALSSMADMADVAAQALSSPSGGASSIPVPVIGTSPAGSADPLTPIGQGAYTGPLTPIYGGLNANAQLLNPYGTNSPPALGLGPVSGDWSVSFLGDPYGNPYGFDGRHIIVVGGRTFSWNPETGRYEEGPLTRARNSPYHSGTLSFSSSVGTPVNPSALINGAFSNPLPSSVQQTASTTNFGDAMPSSPLRSGSSGPSQYNVTITALDQSDQAAADTWRRVIRLTGGSVR